MTTLRVFIVQIMTWLPTDTHEHLTGACYATELEALDEVRRLNDANAHTYAYYIVRDVEIPKETQP